MPILLSQFLDACRWAGALTVMALHATNMFVNLADIASAPHCAPVHAWWIYANYQLGHQAVVGFFVMSGYLVGGAVLAHIGRTQDFLREYMIHRFARIYMVLVPTIALTIAIDTIGRAAFSNTGVYDWPMFEGHFAPALILSNLLSLQYILAPYYGSNGPLWSLACEFWYYVTFPLLCVPFARNYPPLARLAGFALGVAVVTTLAAQPSWFGFGYLLWAMGAFASLASRPLIASRWLSLALFAAALIPIRFLVRGAVLAEHPWLQNAADLTTTILFVNLILTLRFGPAGGWRLLDTKLHKALADFSFSLYCNHMPILIFLRAAADYVLGREWTMQLATPANWALLAVAMTATIVLAYGFSRLTEARTGAARAWLRQVLPYGEARMTRER